MALSLTGRLTMVVTLIGPVNHGRCGRLMCWRKATERSSSCTMTQKRPSRSMRCLHGDLMWVQPSIDHQGDVALSSGSTAWRRGDPEEVRRGLVCLAFRRETRPRSVTLTLTRQTKPWTSKRQMTRFTSIAWMRCLEGYSQRKGQRKG